MLTWMQHHKKYLVITIWISVIAFVGAGFVGWGSYNLNLDKSSSVASVGDEKITFGEFDIRYNQIFNYYNQLSAGNLTQEIAKSMGMENLVLNSLIDDKLLLNFAKELGLRSSDDEIIKDLENTIEFQNQDGSFDKNIYYKLLAQNNINPKNYEEMVRNKITLTKLENSLNLINSELELKMLLSSLFMQDLLNIKIIKADDKNIIKNEEKIKAIWEKNKDKFKTIPIYEIQTFFVNDKLDIKEEDILVFYNENKLNYKDINGKIMPLELVKDKVKQDINIKKLKSNANKTYLKLSKNEMNFQNDINITSKDIDFPIDSIANSKENDILKPFLYKDGYMIVKIKKINPIRNKTFEEAKNEAFQIYKKEEIKQQLISKSEQELKNFTSGINIGFVSRNSTKDKNIISDNLINDAEFSYFLMNVFNKDNNSSYVLLDDKSIIYEIKKQILFPKNQFEKNKNMLEQNIESIKIDELKKELLEKLKEKYSIKIYYKGN